MTASSKRWRHRSSTNNQSDSPAGAESCRGVQPSLADLLEKKPGCSRQFRRPRDSFPSKDRWVPHISLVFCEMWDSTEARRFFLFATGKAESHRSSEGTKQVCRTPSAKFSEGL